MNGLVGRLRDGTMKHDIIGENMETVNEYRDVPIPAVTRNGAAMLLPDDPSITLYAATVAALSEMDAESLFDMDRATFDAAIEAEREGTAARAEVSGFGLTLMTLHSQSIPIPAGEIRCDLILAEAITGWLLYFQTYVSSSDASTFWTSDHHQTTKIIALLQSAGKR